MSVAVEGFYKPERPPFLITFYQLNMGTFYECDNETLVFVSRGPLDHNNPINVATGIGGYSQAFKFRKVDVSITINPTKD